MSELPPTTRRDLPSAIPLENAVEWKEKGIDTVQEGDEMPFLAGALMNMTFLSKGPKAEALGGRVTLGILIPSHALRFVVSATAPAGL
jgi:hypothetical protein